jgi:hypothetical protein
MNVPIYFFLAALVWISGMMVWNHRWYTLYNERIRKPWREAVDRSDFAACDRWRRISDEFPLNRWDYMVNPVAWVKNWDWTP